MTFRIAFDPQGFWIGAAWGREVGEHVAWSYDDGRARASVYRATTLVVLVCLLPCLQIRLTFTGPMRPVEVRASMKGSPAWRHVIPPPPARPSSSGQTRRS